MVDRRTAGTRSQRRLQPAPAFLLALAVAVAGAAAQETPPADVVVLVDTSTSMREPGMDPQWTSLLVTKLLTDLVPGRLSAVRLLDITADASLIPHRGTGVMIPCSEDPSRTCESVDAASDWEADARARQFGVLTRPQRADADFKRRLESHLERRSNNSMFYLGFRAAQGVFDAGRAAGVAADVPRTVVWLSDGRSDGPDAVRARIGELKADGVTVEAIVFGRGDEGLGRSAGIEVKRVSTPAELMKAFAGAFRRIVRAPYEVDNEVAVRPAFEMKPYVDEAWIVVYGDDTLRGAEVHGPGVTLRADYAAEDWRGAGAYRVAHVRNPAVGRWEVRASAGGAGVAYAVVQRSNVGPVFLGPQHAYAGVEVALRAGLRAGRDGAQVIDPEVLHGLTLTLEFEGRHVTLHDDGTHGDEQAGDGTYTARAAFPRPGKVAVRVHARSELVDATAPGSVDVSGEFRYAGPPLEIDLGELGVSATACRRLVFDATHHGAVSFQLAALRRLPQDHQLEVRLPGGMLVPAGEAVSAAPEDPFEVCLVTGPRAVSSQAAGEPWLELLAAAGDAGQRVELRLRWTVQGLTFWQRWGWLILMLLVLLLILWVIGGFVLPQRFPRAFSVAFAPERADLDDLTPQAVKTWPGVGIGFYRNARAYLHPDYRLSGKARGALAALHAERGGVRVEPGRGGQLHRETLDGGWEALAPEGRRGRAGDIFRVGERGPYFKISTRGQR